MRGYVLAFVSAAPHALLCLLFCLLTLIFVSCKGISQTKTLAKTDVSVHGHVCAPLIVLHVPECVWTYKSMGQCPDINPCVGGEECESQHKCLCVTAQ